MTRRRLLITISPVYCGNNNCISAGSYTEGKNIIVIEDKWTVKQKTIEEAIEGLISHETIEWLLTKISEIKDTIVCLHDIVGSKQKVRDYVGNTDGIVWNRKDSRTL